METEPKKQLIPSPQQRPELYDDYDVPAGAQDATNPVKAPDRIAQLIAARQGKKQPVAQAAE